MSLSLLGHSTSDHRKGLHEEFHNCDQLSASGHKKYIVKIFIIFPKQLPLTGNQNHIIIQLSFYKTTALNVTKGGKSIFYHQREMRIAKLTLNRRQST
jgi:hypothetical protein